MCGIAGIIQQPGRTRPLSAVADMARCLRHRGPDDEGYAFFFPDGPPRALGGPDTPEGVFRLGLSHAPRKLRDAGEVPGAVCALAHRRLSILDLSPAGHQPMATPDGRFWIVFNGEIYNYLELGRELSSLGVDFVSRSDTEVLLHAFAQWGTKAFSRLVGMFALAGYDAREKRLWLARDFFGIKPLYYVRWPGGLAFASEIKAL
ncbi:MAG: asparagine synthetase B, partial [Pseudomonadota bacterium]